MLNSIPNGTALVDLARKQESMFLVREEPSGIGEETDVLVTRHLPRTAPQLIAYQLKADIVIELIPPSPACSVANLFSPSSMFLFSP